MRAIITIVTAVLSMFTPVNQHNTYVLTGQYFDGGIIDTIDGNSWLVYPEDFPELSSGDQITVQFDDMGTVDITDDHIVSIQKGV